MAADSQPYQSTQRNSQHRSSMPEQAAILLAAIPLTLNSHEGKCFCCASAVRLFIQQNRSSRRSRRSGGSRDTVCPALHHFDRVVLKQTSGHPLEGLWKGLYGPHGCELLAIRYDPSGSFARIVATKMTGEPGAKNTNTLRLGALGTFGL
jgi:hypothetical protein